MTNITQQYLIQNWLHDQLITREKITQKEIRNHIALKGWGTWKTAEKTIKEMRYVEKFDDPDARKSDEGRTPVSYRQNLTPKNLERYIVNLTSSSFLPSLISFIEPYVTNMAPGIETGYPDYLLEQNIIKLIKNKIKKSKIGKVIVLPENKHLNIDLEGDWLNQRMCFVLGNFYYHIMDYREAKIYYSRLKTVTSLDQPIDDETQLRSFDIVIVLFNLAIICQKLDDYNSAIKNIEILL